MPNLAVLVVVFCLLALAVLLVSLFRKSIWGLLAKRLWISGDRRPKSNGIYAVLLHGKDDCGHDRRFLTLGSWHTSEWAFNGVPGWLEQPKVEAWILTCLRRGEAFAAWSSSGEDQVTAGLLRTAIAEARSAAEIVVRARTGGEA